MLDIQESIDYILEKCKEKYKEVEFVELIQDDKSFQVVIKIKSRIETIRINTVNLSKYLDRQLSFLPEWFGVINV